MNRKTQITIETHIITIIKTSGAPFSVNCEVCQKLVSAFTLGEIANALESTVPELEFMRDAGEIHTVGQNDLQLCGDSLATILRRIKQ